MFNRFYRLEIHSLNPSLVGIFDPACELLPSWTKKLYLCTVAPLPSLWPLPPRIPLPKLNVQYIQTVWGCRGWEWGVFNCAVDHILQEFYTLFLTRFRTYKIVSPPQTKWPLKTTLTLFYTHGLGIVVSHVMVPQPYRFSLWFFT